MFSFSYLFSLKLHSISYFTFAGAIAFDVEYARWLEEQNKQINELRAAVNSHASDTELRMIVDGILAHYDEVFRLKGVAAKADVFHLLSGMWKTPAERCFLWLGGFRSSELLKVCSFWCFILPFVWGISEESLYLGTAHRRENTKRIYMNFC